MLLTTLIIISLHNGATSPRQGAGVHVVSSGSVWIPYNYPESFLPAFPPVLPLFFLSVFLERVFLKTNHKYTLGINF